MRRGSTLTLGNPAGRTASFQSFLLPAIRTRPPMYKKQALTQCTFLSFPKQLNPLSCLKPCRRKYFYLGAAASFVQGSVNRCSGNHIGIKLGSATCKPSALPPFTISPAPVIKECYILELMRKPEQMKTAGKRSRLR